MARAGRLTPPSNQDGPEGFDGAAPPNMAVAYKGAPESDRRPSGDTLTEEAARRIGRETYQSSTSWLNQGWRAQRSTDLRAFQNIHAQGSKYTSSDYRYRSTFYRPKTRSMVRRDEASTAAAFFSNEDVVSITASDDDDPQQQASAEILKALLQYRLTKTIPWFQTIVGARQDCDVMGITVAKAYWRYEERWLDTRSRPRMNPMTGEPETDPLTGLPVMDDFDLLEKIKDHPWVDLIAPENFRFDAGCDWRDPVHSSPYLIEIEPVYVQTALERMEGNHGSEPEWNRVSSSALRGATEIGDDTTRRARETGRVPGRDPTLAKPKDYDICWTRAYILRHGGRDWHFRTLAGGGEILTAPRPIEEVYLHGERPYVVGSVILETHKTYPASKVELVGDLQRAANEDWNMRFDTLKLNLMPRQFVRNGSGIDPSDIRTFMPGKVVLINGKPGEPLQNEVTWDRPPEPGASAYAEQDRINLDFDELTGAFTNSSVQASQINQQSATGMHLMSGEAGTIAEYELRVFAETFVEPLIRLLIKLEQAYETDPVILALAGKKANLFQKYGMDAITDELLNQDVTVRANVGVGASNPALKLRNFMAGSEIIGKIFGPAAAMGANFEEVSKEVFALAGYKDGARFFKPNYDPRVNMLQQQLQKLQKGQKAGPEGDPSKVQAASIQAQSRIQEKQIQHHGDMAEAQLEYETKKMMEDAENWRVMMNMKRELLTHPGGPMGAAQAPPATQHVPVQGGAPQPAPMIPPDMPGAGQEGAPPASVPAAPQPDQGAGQMQMFAQAIGHIAMALDQGNQEVAQGIMDLGQFLAQSQQQNQQAMAEMSERIAQSHETVAAALSRKKRVVRGADGRVEGVEAI